MTPGKLTKGQKSSGNERLQESLNKRAKDLGERPTTSGKQIGLMRSARVLLNDEESLESGDSIVYPSTAPEIRRSVDVVVADVHHENKGSEPSLASKKLFKRRNSAQEALKPRNQSLGKENPRRRELEQGNAWEIQESIESIKEFEDANEIFTFPAQPNPKIERIPEPRSSRKNLNDSNSEESIKQSFGSSEKFIRTSKEKSAVEGETGSARFTEEPKRRRKRWSKNEKNLNLTQDLIANSSDTNHSVENESTFSNEQGIRPVPAPRRKGVSKSFAHESNLAFDNAAFTSDTEEVLRIETEVYEPQGTPDGSQNYRQSTKIEMTNLYDPYEKVLDRENQAVDSENEFTPLSKGRDDKSLNKMESFKASGFADTSDEVETEVRMVKRDGDSEISVNRSKHRNETDAESVLETSELSENGEESDDRVSRSDFSQKKHKKETVKRRRQVSYKGESASFDTGNSLTDISNLPRSKSRRGFSRKSKSKEPRVSKNDSESVRKRKSKQSAKKKSKDDLIEGNTNREEKFISLMIHKADVLKTDFMTRHPMVKVHIVDAKTGNYLKIKNSDDYRTCNYLQPLITGKFDFKENRSIVPNWEEELILEYDFNEIIQPDDKQILILFEILDLLNFTEASFKYNILGSEGCWHKIAWAFLRPVGVNGTLHINKKLRLQLYEPSKTSKKSGRLAKCEVFNWWQSTSKEKYPSTLYVTLKPVDPPIQEPIVYERLSFNELPEIETESFGSCKKSSNLLQLPKWSRLAAQSCKIPNNHLFEPETFENGSFYLTFSNNGKYLACVGSEEDNYPILVYTIPEGKMCAQFVGHANFVYSLNFSNDDKYLLSVSSDQTARIWDMANKIIQHIQMLPHPSYVYCGKFYPGTKNVVVTGCYDSVARIWTKSKSSKRYELTQELYEHKGYVNSLCFQKDGDLITADSIGVIILWTVKKRRGVPAHREWHLLKIIQNNEIENIIVNTIVLHPLGSRLLVHSRDNGLRMIDLETGVVLQRYKGLRNRRLQTTACLSPCGGLVFCGGEDSYLTVWSLESGKRLAKYLIREAKIVACVDYHPLDHILAFSTFGSVSAVQIINFDKNSTGENLGLSLVVDNDIVEDSDDIDITMKFDKTDFLANLNSSYPVRKITNVSKRVEGLDSEVNRSFKTNQKPFIEISKDSANENCLSKQEFLKLKIQRINESQEGLKSRSAARLNNIIEKIDRILISTSLKRDLESTYSSNDMRRQDRAQDSSNSRRDSSSKGQDKVRSRYSRSGSGDRGLSSNTDATMEAHNTSAEFIELQNIRSIRNETSENEESTHMDKKLLRPKSRASSTANILSPSDAESEEERSVYKSSSESHQKVSSKKNQSHKTLDIDVESNRGRKTKRRHRKGKRLATFSDEQHVPENETCIIDLENMKAASQSNPSASDSTGTYTIDKEKFPKPVSSDKSRTSDTSTSVRSSATFTIENEIFAVPKSVNKK